MMYKVITLQYTLKWKKYYWKYAPQKWIKVILLNASLLNANLSKTSHNYHQLSKNNRKVLDFKDSEAAMGIMNSPPS